MVVKLAILDFCLMENSGKHILHGILPIFPPLKIYSHIFNWHTDYYFAEKGEVFSDHYKLLPVDLRDIDKLNEVLAIAGMDPRYGSAKDSLSRSVFLVLWTSLNIWWSFPGYLKSFLFISWNHFYSYRKVLLFDRSYYKVLQSKNLGLSAIFGSFKVIFKSSFMSLHCHISFLKIVLLMYFVILIFELFGWRFFKLWCLWDVGPCGGWGWVFVWICEHFCWNIRVDVNIW